ncbi:hypothetical protein BACI349Y_580047 [Bacillus sp. 349Y]|nr:hypothetical protein BACI349Y_580047 [Bacillus sp. 349Y]
MLPSPQESKRLQRKGTFPYLLYTIEEKLSLLRAISNKCYVKEITELVDRFWPSTVTTHINIQITKWIEAEGA